MVKYVGKTITVTHPNNLSGTWSLLLCLALNVGRSSEFQCNIGWWHFDSMQGLSLFYHPLSLLACAWLHFLSRVNFGVECCFRHCNLDLSPQQVRPRGGRIKQINNICKTLTVTCYPLKFTLGVPLLKLAVHSVSQGLIKGLPKYHPGKALQVRQQ